MKRRPRTVQRPNGEKIHLGKDPLYYDPGFWEHGRPASDLTTGRLRRNARRILAAGAMMIVGGLGVFDAVEQTYRISNAHRLDYVRRAIDAHAIKDGFAGTELGLAGDPSNLAFNGTVTLYLGNCVLPSVAIDIMPSTAPDQNPRLVAEIAGYHATINGSHHDFADYAALQGQTSNDPCTMVQSATHRTSAAATATAANQLPYGRAQVQPSR